MDTFFLVDGKPGLGKSSFTIWFLDRIARGLSKALEKRVRFDLARDICGDPAILTHRILQSTKDHPSVILGDEGVLLGMQARSGTSEISLELDRIASVCRERGATVAILHPNIWGIAAFARNRRAEFWFHVEKRGVVTPHYLKPEIDYLPPKGLPFRKAKKPWSRLTWPSLEGTPLWADYEPIKTRTVVSTLEASERRFSAWIAEAAKREARALGEEGVGGRVGKLICQGCKRTFDNPHNLETHLIRCPKANGFSE